MGGGKSIKITYLVKLIEKYTNTKAKIKFGPFLKGDIHTSKANTTKIKKYINYVPKTRIEKGLKNLYFGSEVIIKFNSKFHFIFQ